MKFNRLILRIASFWTAFALSVIVASLFSDTTELYPMPDTPETVKLSELRPAEKSVAYVSSGDYAVYAAVLDRFFSTQTFVIGEFVLDADWEDSQQYVRSEYFNLSADARKNYRSNNREVRKLRYEFALPFKTVLLISREQEELLFPKGEGGWDRFYRTFPKARGIIYFSRVGFNKNKDEAIVRVKFQSGYSSERNDFYILKKIDGEWHDREQENADHGGHYFNSSVKRIGSFGK